MSLKIRLRRMGRKKAPTYRIVVAESTSPRDGRFVENLGHYNPRSNPVVLTVDRARTLQWLEKGASPTETVAGLLKKAGVFDPAPTAVETAVEAVKSTAQRAASAVAAAASTVVETVTETVAAAVESVREAVTGGEDAAAGDEPTAVAETEVATAEAGAAEPTEDAPAAEEPQA